MDRYMFFRRDGSYREQDADPSRPQTWPYTREEITKVCLDCTERFLLAGKEVVPPLMSALPRLTPELKKLGELLDDIDSRYKEKLTRDFALNKMGMSKSRFSAFFRNQTGMTYVAYINKERIKKAVPMLIETDMTVESIGFDCGFDSLPIFYKCFKKYYGVSPARFRQVPEANKAIHPQLP